MDSENSEDLVKAHDINSDLQEKIEKCFKFIEDGAFDR